MEGRRQRATRCRCRHVRRECWTTYRGVMKRSEIRHAVYRPSSNGRDEKPNGSEAGDIVEAQNVLGVDTELPDVTALHPGDGIRELDAAPEFAGGVAKVVVTVQVVALAE